jgi:hypothetical protein
MAKALLAPMKHTISGPAMPEIPVMSKKMVAYLGFFLTVAPYWKTTDMKIDKKIDKLYENAMHKLGEVNDVNYCNYMERKLRAWYRRFQPKQVAADSAADVAAEIADQFSSVWLAACYGQACVWQLLCIMVYHQLNSMAFMI